MPGGGFPGVDKVQGDNTQIQQECRTGQDANTKQDCRTVALVNSVQEFWADEFSRRGSQYQPATTRLFTQATQTGCGAATSEVGPFYCPADSHVYLDQCFYQELESRFGARAAQGRVTPESWTHGSSSQRQRWFSVGNQTGEPGRCDTFSGPRSEPLGPGRVRDPGISRVPRGGATATPR